MARVNDSSLSLCKTTTSVSEVIGGLGSFIMSYFKSKFPKETFKSSYIVDSVAASTLRLNTAPNQELPYIGMEIQYTGEDPISGKNFMSSTPQYFVANKNRDQYYHKIFHDAENRIKIYAIPDRIRVNINFLLKLQTPMASTDIMHYIRNNFETEGINYVNGIRLPCIIPTQFIDQIGKKFEIDKNNSEDLQNLHQYLMDSSLGSIRESRNMSTGNPMYSYNYVTNVMLQFQDQATADRNVNNLVVQDTSVSFSISAEIDCPSGFLLEIPDFELPATVGSDLDTSSLKFNVVFKQELIPQTLSNGMKHIMHESFVPDVNVLKDQLDISPILSSSLVGVLREINKIGGNTSNLVNLKLYRNNIEVPSSSYTVDFNTMILTTLYPVPNETYSVVLYGDIFKLNTINDLITDNSQHLISRLEFLK